jgi:signal transduction histidine kinase
MLRNVITHADARHAGVQLVRVGDMAELSIVDDGKGFDITQARNRGGGLGLVSITERVRLAGGTASIVTEQHKGTRVQVRIPIARQARTGTGDPSEDSARTVKRFGMA